MAHIDADHFAVRPDLRAQRESQVQRTQTMLALAGAGSMMIIVAAALFMTVF